MNVFNQFITYSFVAKLLSTTSLSLFKSTGTAFKLSVSGNLSISHLSSSNYVLPKSAFLAKYLYLLAFLSQTLLYNGTNTSIWFWKITHFI